MSIWMLLTFAVCMLLGVIGLEGPPEWSSPAQVAFVSTLAVFAATVLFRGIRRPVV